MPKIQRIPDGFDLNDFLKKASEEVKHYMIIFVGDDGRIGSGTLVNACGHYGILTAHHVLSGLVLRSSEFAFCLSDRVPTSLWYKPDCFESVIIGSSQKDVALQRNGPDLAFFIIRDQNLISTLKSLKSFYYPKPTDLSCFDFELKRVPWPWLIAGCPYESSKLVDKNYKGAPLTKMTLLVGQATFHSRTIRDGFDYIELSAGWDQTPFPKSYEGVSGGGFWIVPSQIDTSGRATPAAPVLGGVAFYQHGPVHGDMIITGHGYDSIYTRLAEALNSSR